MQGVVLGDVGADPQCVREGDVARVGIIAGAAWLVGQLQSTVTAVAVWNVKIVIVNQISL